MTDTVNNILANADYFILLLFRVGGLVFPSPIFGRTNIPDMFKIGLIFFITVLFFMYRPINTNIAYATLFGFFLLIAAELVLGMALAFVTNLFLSLTAYTAGEMIDMQIGFGIVNVFDAQNNTQIPMMGNLLNIILILTFFLVDGHLRLIDILDITITAIPVGNIAISPAIGLVALEVFILSFVLGVMVALPVVASGLTLEFCFGVLMRSVPQMNMFVVGIPMKIILGFMVVILLIPSFMSFSDTIFSHLFESIEKMFATFRVSV